MKYIHEFIKNYRKVIGNKYFPCVFVQNDFINPVHNYSAVVDKKDVLNITLNGCFPLIKIQNNYNRKECTNLLNSIINEIKKEKDDEFPYSLAYQEQLQINFCIRNQKLFSILNVLCFVLIIAFSSFDTLFILNTPDFLNETKKVDDIFLGIRLNINAINFICSIIFIKYALFEREKYLKIRRLEKYTMIANIITYIIQIILHFRIQHVSIIINLNFSC